jgi:hypothetical protein
MVDHEERAAAQALAREYGIPSENFELQSPRTPELWSLIVEEADCALHLHTSVFGHLGPYVQISLSHGCPVIVEQSGPGEDMPQEVVFQIVPGLHEASQLLEVFHVLQNRGAVDFGGPGREYARRNYNYLYIAQQLSEILQRSAPQVSYVMDRWDALRKRAQRVLLEEVRELVNGQATMNAVDPFEQIISPSVRDLGW